MQGECYGWGIRYRGYCNNVCYIEESKETLLFFPLKEVFPFNVSFHSQNICDNL